MAALVQGMFCDFYLVKITPKMPITQQPQQLNQKKTHIWNPRNIFDVCLTELKNNQILLMLSSSLA
jgi:hypothetical protein